MQFPFLFSCIDTNLQNISHTKYIPENRYLSLKYFWSLFLWKFFKVLDIFQFFLEFLFWRLGVVPAISIKGRLGSLGVVKNNTGKYHGGRDDPNQQLQLEKATS